MSAVRKHKPGKALLFDTLEYVKKLEAAGIPQKQAEAQVRLFSEVMEENICSKQDLLETESRLAVTLKELEVNLKETEGRLRVEIENVRKNLTLQISETKSDIIKWFIGTFLASMGLMMGFVTFLFRMSH